MRASSVAICSGAKKLKQGNQATEYEMNALRPDLDMDLPLGRVPGPHPGAFPDREPLLRRHPGGLKRRGGVHNAHAERSVGVAPHGVVVLHHEDNVLHLIMRANA